MKHLILAGLSLFVLSPVFAESGIEFSTPKGGWRHAQSQSQYTQSVQYPASRVNSENFNQQSQLIAGRIKNHVKDSSKPARLIVNGIAMPQAVNDDGSFSRPYAFGRGNNSVELRTATGDKKRVQFYENNKAMTSPKLRVVLSWDSDNTDLDLHVVTPDGGHSYYGNRVLKNGGALDVDVTTGYGPEIFSAPSPQNGTYLVYLNYYGGESDKVMTTATLTVISNEGRANEKKQSFRVPMRAAGELTLVKSFHYRG